jgi:hypothetical protein
MAYPTYNQSSGYVAKPVNDKYNFQGFQKKPIAGIEKKNTYDSYGDNDSGLFGKN